MILTHLLNKHPISIEVLLHLTSVDKQVITTGIRLHKTKSISVTNNAARNQIHLIDQAIVIAAIGN